VYVRVTRTQHDPGQVTKEDIVAVAEAVAAAMKALPGFVSYQNGVDWETGAGIAISTWQDKEPANFSRDALGDVMSRATSLRVRLELPAIFEITATA
jgi:hypothetical protein